MFSSSSSSSSSDQKILPLPKYNELINKCWDPEIKNRPNIQEILEILENIANNVNPSLDALFIATRQPQGMDKYKFINFLTNAFTCLVTDNTSKEQYIMKIRKNFNHLDRDRYERENKILSTLTEKKCPYLIEYIDGFFCDFGGDWKFRWCLIYSYYPNGSLNKKINTVRESSGYYTNKPNAKEDEIQIIDWTSQLCEALLFLQTNHILIDSNKLILSNLYFLIYIIQLN